MQGCTAVLCLPVHPVVELKKDNPAKVDHEGTDNLVAVARRQGTRPRFDAGTSFSPTPAAGQGNNDNYVLNAPRVLDEKPPSSTQRPD